jgi:hypothetical protein
LTEAREGTKKKKYVSIGMAVQELKQSLKSSSELNEANMIVKNCVRY